MNRRIAQLFAALAVALVALIVMTSYWQIWARGSLEAAMELGRKQGLAVLSLGDEIEGEARDVAAQHAQLARDIRAGKGPVKAPCLIVSGGETTVTLPKERPSDGRGGRNVEFLLSLAIALNGAPGVSAIAGDTDGVDGVEEIAGAIVTANTLARAQAAGMKVGL